MGSVLLLSPRSSVKVSPNFRTKKFVSFRCHPAWSGCTQTPIYIPSPSLDVHCHDNLQQIPVVSYHPNCIDITNSAWYVKA